MAYGMPAYGPAQLPRRGYARTWVLGTAIVTLAIAAALAIGGVIFWVSTTTSADGEYGHVSLPGRGVLTLPAGHVDMTYTVDEDNPTIYIPAFGISVVNVATGQRALVGFDPSGHLLTVNGVSHIKVGSLDVPSAGRYRVRVDGFGRGPDAEVRFGVAHQHGAILVAALIVAGVLLAGGLPLLISYIVASRRHHRAVARAFPPFYVGGYPGYPGYPASGHPGYPGPQGPPPSGYPRA